LRGGAKELYEDIDLQQARLAEAYGMPRRSCREIASCASDANQSVEVVLAAAIAAIERM
jgi:hypothetical protein